MKRRSHAHWAAVATVFGLFAAGADGHAQSVRMMLDREELTLEEQAVLSVTVEGGGRTEPKPPAHQAFDLRYVGAESQMSLVNGDFSSRVIYRWLLLPKQPGEFEIGPATIEVDGKSLHSETLRVKVVPASAQPQSRPVFVTASISDSRPYVGEQVLYRWRFYRRARVAEPRLDALELGGFLVEDLGDVRQLRVTESGMEYEVSEIRKALFAQRPGAVTIPPARLSVQLVQASRPRGVDPFDSPSRPFDEFFGRMRTESLSLVTEPLQVEVRPLPSPPDDFSGLVGEFTIESTASASQVPVGESLTQRIVVSGSGNVRLMGDLPLDDADGFKVYRDQPVVEIDRSGDRLRGRKTFTRALVPQRAGSISIPEARLVFFDPERESYVTATAAALALDVAPGAANEDLRLTESLSPGGGKVAVRILADDLLPIRSDLDLLDDGPSGGLLAAALLAPPLLFLSFLAVRRRAHRHASDRDLRRRRTALRRALGAIEEGGAAAPDASGLIRRYVGDRLGAQGGALTSRECAEQLAAAGAGDAVVAEVTDLLSRLEAADFGGGADSSLPTAAQLRATLERLDRELRGKR